MLAQSVTAGGQEVLRRGGRHVWLAAATDQRRIPPAPRGSSLDPTLHEGYLKHHLGKSSRWRMRWRMGPLDSKAWVDETDSVVPCALGDF